jgi:spore germination protein GerM
MPYDASPKPLSGPPPKGLYAPPPTAPNPPSRHGGTAVDLYYVVGGDLRPFVAKVPTPVTEALMLEELELDASRVGSEVSSDIPIGSNLVSTGVVHGLAGVGLDAEYTELTPAEQALELGQIVYTLTSASTLGVKKVAFYYNGQAVSVLGANGEIVEGPADQADYCVEAVTGCK